MRLRKVPKAPLQVVASCRGEGLGYVAVCGSRDVTSIAVRASGKDGVSVPCSLYAVTSRQLKDLLAPNADAAWVVVLPLLSVDCTLTFSADGVELLTTTFPAIRSKVSSRVLSIAKPHIANLLRGFERRYGYGRTQVAIHEVWPSDAGQVVWRIHVLFPVDNKDDEPHLCLFDDGTREIATSYVVMEDQIVPGGRDASQLMRKVTFSCSVSEGTGSFYAVAQLGDDGAHVGFDGMNAPRAAGMLAGTRGMIGGATANAEYDDWFEVQRATDIELKRQRETCTSLPDEAHPLLSLVMPVYRTPEAYLREAIDSVCAQSYDRWELVVVNASGPCAEVDRVLGDVRDERIRVIEIENKSIAENTNAGIAKAQGDYVGFIDHDDVLEPDALWHVAQAIAQHPEVDLLYSDEDHFDGMRVHGPAFKTFPNYGKLYEHNYVTHLLVVSRWALDHTKRSGAEVAGAQDYDLTLRVFEIARDIVQVPRVLYHWREHEGSTSGGNDQKPFAHVAGQRALQAHLDRRGIAAHVDDGILPYTYRVRYELPDPAPKVSIVIPTRDQAELLRTCVTSILEKSTYPDFEVVLVENNSADEKTFALYDELQQLDERVHVVTWQPPEPGAFNYSALVNYGVAHASGELVVLLNNDTEVIKSHWIEEMAGCLMRPEVGVVGAKLLFKDGLIQHVGMVANPEGNFCHVCQNLTKDALGPGYAAAMPGDYSMVTGACQMVSRALFDELGGYDEKLAVGFNDGDFCLRARDAGYAVTVCAHALLYHKEFSTRGRESTDARLRERYLRERAYMMGKYAAFFAAGDPALNPNLDPFGAYFDIAR